MNQVGYEFRPYEDDLVAYFLRLKDEGKTWLVEGAINRNYVICRLEYTGNDLNILFDNPTHPTVFPNATNCEGSVVDRSIRENSVSSNYPNYECDSASQFPQRLWDYETNKEIGFYFVQNHSAHCPKPPVTGFFTDGSSDSNTDSLTCGDTESISSSDEPYNSPSSNTLDPLPNYEAQEQPKQLKLHLQGKEKVISKKKSECEVKMAEDLIKNTPSSITVKQNWIVLEVMSHMDSQWNYLKTIFIGFLLFVCIIGWIIMV